MIWIQISIYGRLHGLIIWILEGSHPIKKHRVVQIRDWDGRENRRMIEGFGHELHDKRGRNVPMAKCCSFIPLFSGVWLRNEKSPYLHYHDLEADHLMQFGGFNLMSIVNYFPGKSGKIGFSGTKHTKMSAPAPAPGFSSFYLLSSLYLFGKILFSLLSHVKILKI